MSQYGHPPHQGYGAPQPAPQQPMGGSPAHSNQHLHEAKAYPQTPSLPAKWQWGLFDCFSPFGTCCLSYWCPCVLFGRIHARERGERDPDGLNGMCFAHCVLLYCGCSPILQCINRGNMKEKYNMDSNLCTDCLTAFCCPCCELIQEDKESIVRQTGLDPKTKQPYTPPQGMHYP